MTRAHGHSQLAAPQSRHGLADGNQWLQLADLARQPARIEFLAAHPELVHPSVVSNLAALVPQLVKSDREKALAVAEAAVLIANRLGDAESMAQSLRAKANAHYAMGQNKTALEHHGKALRLFRSLGNTEQVARTLSSSIQPLILQGRYRRAFAAAREARKIFMAQRNRWRVARLDLNLGNVLDRQDRSAEALKCYERAYQYLSLHEQDDPEGIAVALHNMAVAHVRLNDFRKATATYENARSFAAAHDMPVLVGQADYNIAWLHYVRGDYGRAISMLRAARETCRASSDDYHVALCHLDLSEIYLELNLVPEGAEAAEQAGALFSRLGMRYEEAKSVANLAVATRRQGDTVRALELFRQARRIFVREKNKVLPAVIDLHRAQVLFDDGRNVIAGRLVGAALHALQRFKITNRAIECRLLLSRLDLRQHKVRAAQQQCTRALKSLAKLQSPALTCQAYALKGQIQDAAGHNRRAYAAYQRAADYVDNLRNRIHGEELKISFMKDHVEIYQGLVGLCMKRSRGRKHGAVASAEIFRHIEQAKSRTLFDLLSSSRSPSWLAPNGQAENARKIRELREELNWFFHMTERAQLEPTSRHQVSALRAESQRREREILRLSREHGSADDRDPEQSASSFTVDQVRQSLPADAVILDYFQVHDHLVVVLLSHTRLEIVPLGGLSRISTVLDLLQLQLSKLRLGPDYVKRFAGVLLQATQSHLQNLYKLLVEPIRRSLTGHHLVIAPCGILHQLPFHALFDGGQYLTDEFTVSYAPSASVYSLCQQRSAQAGRRSLVLGIPDPAVPFVEEEVEAVAACLPHSEVFLGQSATVECLRQQGPCSRFLHIATHGHFRRDNPMFSGIRLGDSYLSLYDLYELKLPAELVTLSGCSTGLNVVAAGDELLGLARGLIHAGAETSMLTLWDVQDQSSAQLMKFFYTNLAGVRSKAVALQQAMQQVRSERPHPYYWAPFVLMGKA